ncbi:4a-hydroxytetrahydrobiopterin dehydratase [Mycobacteroides abscessus]
MALLTDDQINAALAGLPGWTREGDSLRRAVTFDAFLDGIDAVRRIAEHAESVDHHPDIDIRGRHHRQGSGAGRNHRHADRPLAATSAALRTKTRRIQRT